VLFGGLIFDFDGSTAVGTFDLITWGNSIVLASDFSYTNLGGGNTGTFQINGNTLQFVAVPEPSALAFLSGLAAFLAFFPRRRKGRT